MYIEIPCILVVYVFPIFDATMCKNSNCIWNLEIFHVPELFVTIWLLSFISAGKMISVPDGIKLEDNPLSPSSEYYQVCMRVNINICHKS